MGLLAQKRAGAGQVKLESLSRLCQRIRIPVPSFAVDSGRAINPLVELNVRVWHVGTTAQERLHVILLCD